MLVKLNTGDLSVFSTFCDTAVESNSFQGLLNLLSMVTVRYFCKSFEIHYHGQFPNDHV